MMGKGLSLPEVLVVVALVGVLAVLLLANFLSARQLAEERVALAYAQNVLKAAWAHLSENQGAAPVEGDCADGFTAGSYSVPDPGPGVASCQVAWTGQFFRVEVRSRSGRSFTLP
jgi:type IV pilus assembly protein PilA